MSTGIRFTVAEYDRMIEQGVLADRHDQRLELVHGEIREMTPPSPAHDDTIDLLNYWSIDNTPRDKVRVRIQNSLGIPALDSVPQPDVAWMKARNYRTRRPQPQDVLLLVEVAESSLAYDRGEKAELYAESRIIGPRARARGNRHSPFGLKNLRALTRSDKTQWTAANEYASLDCLDVVRFSLVAHPR